MDADDADDADEPLQRITTALQNVTTTRYISGELTT
jgi:hypothetical protein